MFVIRGCFPNGQTRRPTLSLPPRFISPNPKLKILQHNINSEQTKAKQSSSIWISAAAVFPGTSSRTAWTTIPAPLSKEEQEPLATPSAQLARSPQQSCLCSPMENTEAFFSLFCTGIHNCLMKSKLCQRFQTDFVSNQSFKRFESFKENACQRYKRKLLSGKKVGQKDS